ncbi:PX-associated-domain-containing protein [Dendryphion nanum]|uniref:PX-associated-domain-containing protein n=1 Tax=Dendryphion nanum TaxID=256645 RepID=A0A9P9IDF7_9PLEO|nr:PX-associated-domain-containing protein [Dendryphion nanum]
MSSSPPLSPEQSHALFDILIHHQLYSEIEAFKYPTAITTYGYPFRKEDGIQTTSPLLQNMLNKFALRLPGLSNVGLDFWQEKVKMLVVKLGEAELSESYDKGAIGARKALATAISAILEYVARGMLGGYPVAGRKKEGDEKAQEKQYDKSDADDLLRAWDDTVREAIYGNLLDDAFKKTGETGRLEDHSSQIQAAHEYILLNLASFMHHTFIMSPDGQYLLRVLENVHRLIPYTMIRQTLRVGNAATMINGMVRLTLTKISVTAVTNWFGLTNNTNDGMNLMQQILSTVMAWDTSEFQKRAQKLESQRDAPDKKFFKAIKTYVYSSRDRHDAARNISIQESKSIIAVILETSEPSIDPDTLSEYQHELLQEHFGNLQSIRDREELTKIFCRMQPDLLTSAVKDAVAAFDPVIRGVHNAVNLSDTVTDAENFLTDLIKISKPKKPSGYNSKPQSRSTSRDTSPHASSAEDDLGFASITDPNTTYARDSVPKVEDYVQLLRKHMPSSHKFLHQICKNAPELANQYLTFAKSCATEFRVHDSSTPSSDVGEAAAGNMTGPLHSIFSSLSSDQQKTLTGLLDHHAKHLKILKSTSHSRLNSVLSSSRPSTASSTKDASSPKKSHATKPAGTTHGPGMYLARWHALLDSTLITPATIHGPVRHGWEVKGELDGKGLKVDTLINRPKKKAVVNMAEGTGDAVERRERKRDGHEEEKTQEVWNKLRDPWVGVCKGLEVMGDLD